MRVLIVSILLLFFGAVYPKIQVTNIVTNISEFDVVQKTNTITKHRYVPVRKTIYREIVVTNYQNLYYPVYETNTITETVYITNETPSTEIYRQHHIFSSGYSYCGRFYFGYDIFNIFSNGYTGIGLGTWMTWNTTHFPDHQLDVGIKFNITW